jgi:hypothetical protein
MIDAQDGVEVYERPARIRLATLLDSSHASSCLSKHEQVAVMQEAATNQIHHSRHHPINIHHCPPPRYHNSLILRGGGGPLADTLRGLSVSSNCAQYVSFSRSNTTS